MTPKRRTLNLSVIFAWFFDWLIFSGIARELTEFELVGFYSQTTPNSLICSDEGLTFGTSALESLYGGQFSFSYQLSW